MSNSKRGKIGVRDVDRHKGEEVGEGEKQEGEQPTMCICNFCFIFFCIFCNWKVSSLQCADITLVSSFGIF